MIRLIDRIFLKRPAIIEYTCAFISSILVFVMLLVKSKEAMLSAIAAPTIQNIIIALILSIASIWVFWVANRFFAHPLCGLLTGYDLVFSPPVKPNAKDNKNNIGTT
jgi:hypothetical protein